MNNSMEHPLNLPEQGVETASLEPRLLVPETVRGGRFRPFGFTIRVRPGRNVRVARRPGRKSATRSLVER